MAKAVVKGDREIRANLKRARESVGGAALKENLFASLQPMKEKTEENAFALRNYPGKHPGWPGPASPRKGGHLDEGLVIVKHLSRGQLFLEVWLTFSKRSRKIAHLVEFGTAPHWQPGRGVMHPGAKPEPFARPAFEETKEDVAMAVGRFAWDRISGSLIGVYRK